MKKNILVLIFTISLGALFAQEGPTSTTPPSTGTMAGYNCAFNMATIFRNNCNLIWFCYDASGNRIARFVPLCQSNNSGGGGQGPYALAPPIDMEEIDESSTIAILEASFIYPNPTLGKTKIEMDKELEDVFVSVLDISGNILQTKIFSGSSLELDLSTLAGGTYFIVISKDQENVKKSVIKH